MKSMSLNSDQNDVPALSSQIGLMRVSAAMPSGAVSENSSSGNTIIKDLPEVIVGPISEKLVKKIKKTKKTPDDGDEDEASAEESRHKSRKRTLKKVNMAVAFHRELRATGALLFDFYRRYHKLNVHCTPRQHFCKEQVLKWVLNIMSYIQNQRLTFQRGKEMFINLYNLFITQAELDPSVTSFFHSLLVMLNASFGELQCLYQSVSREHIDYTALIEHLGTLIHRINYKLPAELKDFEPVRLLGAGSFGAVYKVQHAETGDEYTLKVVSASSYPMIEHAIADRMCASVTKHPMVVFYVACFPIADYHVSIMEYFPGVDLEVVMRTMRHFGVDELQYIAAQLVAGLQHMHYRGLLHRDMKLGNVLISEKGKVKIIDFDTVKVGLALNAKRFDSSFVERTAGEHKDQEVAGTVPYMAPEVVSRRRYGRAADWWSLGVALFRLLEGRLPFVGKTDDEIKQAIQKLPLKFHRGRRGWRKSAQARSFISALLEKDSVGRLGTKSYDDLIKHDFFNRMNWRHLERVRIFDLPVVGSLLSQKAASGNPIPNKSIRPELLKNVPIDASQLILVYAAQTEHVGSSNSPILEPTVDESSPCPTSTKSMTRLEAESISVMYHSEWELGLTFGMVSAEDGNTFPIIASLRARHSKVTMLIEGDIVTRIDDTSVISVPLSVAQAALAQPGHHIIQVLNSNPFRVFSRALNSRILLRNYPSFDTVLTAPVTDAGNLSFWRRRSSQDFVTVRRMVGKSLKAKSYQYFFISGVEDSVEANIFVGDLILEADGTEAKDLTLDDMQKILQCKQGPVSLKMMATSALRVERYRFDRIFATFPDHR